MALQDSMGWMDCHLHNFFVQDPDKKSEWLIGIPDEFSPDILPGWKASVCDYLKKEKDRCHYTYDFGEDWNHIIVLEKILPTDPKTAYPICVGGKRACPPEDVGGIPGYEMLCEVLVDPKHEDHASFKERFDNFQPENFDVSHVEFDNPQDRLEMVLEELELP